MKRAYDTAFAEFMGESIYRYACIKDSERVRALEKELENVRGYVVSLGNAIWMHNCNIIKCNGCNATVLANWGHPWQPQLRNNNWSSCNTCALENDDDDDDDVTCAYCPKCRCEEHIQND